VKLSAGIFARDSRSNRQVRWSGHRLTFAASALSPADLRRHSGDGNRNPKEIPMSRLSAFLAAAVLAITAFVAPAPASAAQGTSAFSLPIQTATSDGNFTGTLRITGFAVQNNTLVATGTVTGTVAGVTGLRGIVRTVTLPVITSTSGKMAGVKALSCDILHLELGPLDLDLLGLVVHLDRVVLDVSAVPGAGNLLGNLLCSVTNLLNGGGALSQIANLLNQILALLG
jgi:hypothetical protein